MKSNLKQNAVLNIVRTSLSVIAPLITYPYVLRVLGVENVGKVSYVASIINYFILLAMLGISTYAVREGAKIRSNKEALNQFSGEVLTINVCSTIFSYLLLILAAVFIERLKDYRLLLFIQSFAIVFTTFSVDWINTIFEDFLFITVRTIVFYAISIVLTFVLVKNSADYYLYALISIVSSGLVCIFNWLYCRRYVSIRLVKNPNWNKHLKQLLILFANGLTILIYVSFDTTMLGWMAGDYYVGLYALPTKIYTVLKNLMVAVYSVAIPRLAVLLGEYKSDEFKCLYTKLWKYLTVLLLPVCIGVVCTAGEVVLLFGGSDYFESATALRILAVGLIFAIFGGLVTACLNVIIGREKDNLTASIWGAVLNCGLNLILIPMFKQNGAAFTTLLAELFVFLFCFARIPDRAKYFDYETIAKTLVHAVTGTVVIVGISFFVDILNLQPIISLITKIFASGAAYFGILYAFHDSVLQEMWSIIKEKFSAKKSRSY